jgi:hypothetical protein
MFKIINYSFRYLPILVIPILFLFFSLELLKILGPLSLRHGDPDFIYLFSGITMGNLHFDVGHVDNPGTPLQIIVAIVTRLTHLIAGNGSYIEDVISRPDFYLHKVVLFNQLTISFLMFFMSYKLLPVLKSYFMLILLQLSFFTGWAVFYNTSVILPEVLIFVPVVLLVIQLINYVNSPSPNLPNKEALTLAIICGFGLSLKLDYFPLFFIPIFILKGWKQIGLYTGISFVCFVLFAFPIIKRYKFFYNWVTGLILHSGKYGIGERNFIDLKSFFGNLKQLIDFYPFLYLILGLLIVLSICVKFNLVRPSETKLARVLYGILFTTVIHTLLVAKHFGLGYMMPSIYMLPFMIFIFISCFPIVNYLKNIIASIFILIILLGFIKERQSVLAWKIPQMKNKIETSIDIKKITGHKPLMIIDQPYNFYYPESPLLFGWFFQGKYKPVYKEELIRLYAEVYVYDGGPKKFFLWGDLFSMPEITGKYSQVYCFVNGTKNGTFLQMYKEVSSFVDTSCVYRNTENGAKLYYLSANKSF